MTVNKKRYRSGLTLIELIIYLSLMAVIMVVVVDLSIRITSSRGQSAGQEAINQNTSFLMSRLTYSIQKSKIISVTASPDKLTLQFTSSPEQVFTLNPAGQVLYHEGAAGSDIPLTTDNVEVSRINVGDNIFEQLTNTDANSVQIRFKITNIQTGYSQNFQTAVLSRGK